MNIDINNCIVRKNLKWPKVVKIVIYNTTNINIKSTTNTTHIRRQKHRK